MEKDSSTKVSRENNDLKLNIFGVFAVSYWQLTLFLILVIVLLISIMCAVPPVSRDALTHHLYIPKLYLLKGAIHEIRNIEFSYFPMNLDLLYMIPLYFGNDIIPKFIHYSFSLATSVLIYFYLRKNVSAAWASLGSLYFLTTPIIIKLSVTAYVDLGLIFFTTASLLLILKWAENTTQHRILLGAAIFCGLALGTKYNGLISLLILPLFIPILFRKDLRNSKKSDWQALSYSIAFIAICLLVYSPWGGRNVIWTGNPFHPLFGSVFGTGETDVMGGFGPFVMRKAIYQESLLEILLIPFRIFFEGQDNNPQFFDGKLNPLLGIMPIFAFFRPAQNIVYHRERLTMLCFVILYILIVFFQRDLRIRYIGPAIPFLVILSILGLKNLFHVSFKNTLYQRTFRVATMLIVIGFFLINIVYLYGLFRSIQPITYLSGKVSRLEYISKFRPEYPVIDYANKHLDKNSKILCVFLGNRGYYIDINHFFDLRNKTSFLCSLIKQSTSSKDLFNNLQRLNVSHLFIRYDLWRNWAEQKLTTSEKIRYDNFRNDFTEPLTFNGNYVLLSIQPKQLTKTSNTE